MILVIDHDVDGPGVVLYTEEDFELSAPSRAHLKEVTLSDIDNTVMDEGTFVVVRGGDLLGRAPQSIEGGKSNIYLDNDGNMWVGDATFDTFIAVDTPTLEGGLEAGEKVVDTWGLKPLNTGDIVNIQIIDTGEALVESTLVPPPLKPGLLYRDDFGYIYELADDVVHKMKIVEVLSQEQAAALQLEEVNDDA